MELLGFYLPYGLEWLNLLVRWLHVITGIAWIGASFYFVWLDNSLRPPAPGSDLARQGRVRRAVGRARRRFLQSAEIHGGAGRAAGGTALVQMGSLFDLAVRLRAADHRLLLQCPGHDGRPLRGRPDESWQAIGIGLGSLVLGWIVYDLLCRSPLGKHDLAFGGVIFAAPGRRGLGADALPERPRRLHPRRRDDRHHHGGQRGDGDHSRPAQDGRMR
jgi:hypothetical protein